MARAFVTGGTGFVGGRLVLLLRRRGWDVVVLARRPDAAAALVEAGAQVVAGDLLDPDGLTRAVADAAPDVVFHLGAWYEIGIRDATRMEAINAGGTAAMLAATRAAGDARFVHCSTVGVYGDSGDVVRDETWYHPDSVASLHYTRTKRAAHEAVLAAAADGMDAVIVSPVSIFGPGDRSIIGTLLRYLVRGLLLAGFFRGTKLGFVHVDDVASALLAAFEHGGRGRDYIVTDRTLTMGEVLTTAARVAGRRPPMVWLPPWLVRLCRPFSPLVAPFLGQGPWVLGEAVSMMDGVHLDYDGRRARAELKWEPGDFDEQMRETIAWFSGSR